MYAVRLIMACLLSLCIGTTCLAATFEKVSSSFSIVRNGHISSSFSNQTLAADLNGSWTADDFDTNSIIWGVSPILKEGTAYLMSLDSAENAETRLFYDRPGGGAAASTRTAADASDPYHNRVYTGAYHRPVITFWQPGWYTPHTYDINMNVKTEATVYYRIMPLNGENAGAEVTLTAEGWTEHEENSTGPLAFAYHINYLTNTASSPVYIINPSAGGVWRTIDGKTSFTARIGDIIGMKTSVYSSIGPISGTIPEWGGREYMPLGLFTASQISVTMTPKLPGDMNNDGVLSLDDAILGLQVVSGLAPAGIRSDAGGDVNGDNKIGLEEAIYIIQKMADLRPNEQVPVANY